LLGFPLRIEGETLGIDVVETVRNQDSAVCSGSDLVDHSHTDIAFLDPSTAQDALGADCVPIYFPQGHPDAVLRRDQ